MLSSSVVSFLQSVVMNVDVKVVVVSPSNVTSNVCQVLLWMLWILFILW